MKVLQIANDFCRTKVHSNMVRSLDKIGVSQIVFNAVRGKEFIGRNAFEAKHTEFIYANVVKPYHRYFYHIKLNHVYKEMLKRIDVRSIDICHASTLLTDGGLAYKLYKDYRIPYIVAIRNTDVNGFMDKAPHTWIDAIRILLCAKKIVFISEGLRQKFESHFIVKLILNRIKHKFLLLPNGIDDYFLDRVDRKEHEGHNIVYVGNFTGNKNVVRLANAVLEVRKEPKLSDVTLTLVGGGREPDTTLPDLIKNHPEAIQFLGPIYDKSELHAVYNKARMFAMASIHETFGLVYIEALSQNLPVLYTKGQGIDGLFDERVGISVDPLSVEEIADAIKKILNGKYSNKNLDFENFRWANIVKKYREHYKAILGEQNLDKTLLESYKIG